MVDDAQPSPRFLEPNPRHLERLLNVYRLVRSLAQIRHEASVLDDPGGTIRLLALAAQWPYTVSAMMDVLDRLAAQEEAGGASFPKADPLVHLHDSAKSDLDAARQNALDADVADLEELIAQTSGRLTWNALVSLRRYIVNFNPAVEEELRRARAAAAQPCAGHVLDGAQASSAADALDAAPPDDGRPASAGPVTAAKDQPALSTRRAR